MYFNQQKNNGFTLIEMLVALSLFTIVVTIVVGSLLVLIDGSQQLQGEQSVMTNLSFAMDSMTREIRTGSKYLCWELDFPRIFSDQEGKNFGDCVLGNNNKKYQGVSFIEAGSSITGSGATRIAYFYDSDGRTIKRRVGNNATAQSIVSNGISIDKAEFFVTGSTPFSFNGSDVNQPTVTIVIEASETGAAGEKPYVLQTTITQRELDL